MSTLLKVSSAFLMLLRVMSLPQRFNAATSTLAAAKPSSICGVTSAIFFCSAS